MPAAVSDRPCLELCRGVGWWFRRWGGRDVIAAITGRHHVISGLLDALPYPVATVGAEQIHHGGVAAVRRAEVALPVPGCDALVTALPGTALVIRTADCLPIFFAEPSRRVVGLAHAGWRGLAVSLIARVIAAFRWAYQSRAEDLRVAIGPAIRACCYEVRPDVARQFGPFVRSSHGRVTCDLIGAAMEQLRRCGIRSDRIFDAEQCTACHADRWFSLRREGPSIGRMTSLILLRP